MNVPAGDVPALVFALAILAALLAIGFGVRKAAPTLRKIGHAVDDFVGEPARPGVDARPGVVESVRTVRDELGALTRIVDERTKGLAGDLAALSTATGRRLDEQTARVDEHGRRLDEHGRRLDEHAALLARLSGRVDPPGPPLPP